MKSFQVYEQKLNFYSLNKGSRVQPEVSILSINPTDYLSIYLSSHPV